MSNIGSPKDLRDAIMRVVSMVPLCDVDSMGPAIIKDYLSQKFQVALLRHKSDEAQAAIQDLWLMVIKEKDAKNRTRVWRQPSNLTPMPGVQYYYIDGDYKVEIYERNNDKQEWKLRVTKGSQTIFRTKKETLYKAKYSGVRKIERDKGRENENS